MKLHQPTLSRIAKVPFTAIRKAEVDDEHWRRLAMAASEMARHPLWVDQTPRPTIGDTEAKCRHLKSEPDESGRGRRWMDEFRYDDAVL